MDFDAEAAFWSSTHKGPRTLRGMLRSTLVIVVCLIPTFIVELADLDPVPAPLATASLVLGFIAVGFGFAVVISPIMNFKDVVEYSRAFPRPRYIVGGLLLVVGAAVALAMPFMLEAASEYRGRKNPYPVIGWQVLIAATALITAAKMIFQSAERSRQARIDFEFNLARRYEEKTYENPDGSPQGGLQRWAVAERAAAALIDQRHGAGEGTNALERYRSRKRKKRR